MHIRSLDGLRGLAALIVVVVHFAIQTKIGTHVFGYGAGQIGVMIFFVLSGFLMGYLYLDTSPNRPNVLEFFNRRFARVLPLYFLLVLASVAMMHYADHWHYWIYEIRDETLWKPLLLVSAPNVLWTVPVECHFYLLFPLIWLAFNRWGKFAVTGVLIAQILFVWSDGRDFHPLQSIDFAGGLGTFFFGGVLLSIWMGSISDKSKSWNWIFLLCLAAIPFLFPAFVEKFTGSMENPGKFMWSSPIYLGVSVILVAATIKSELADRLFGSVPMRFLGKISYSLYLLHGTYIRV